MKILLAGDTHGNVRQFEYLHMIMQAQGIEQGIVLGDFGLWPGPHGKRFLTRLEKLCIRDGIFWRWLDGNHEDHARIQMWMKRQDAYTKMHRTTDHVWYMPRGYRFEIDGIKFAVLGGAWSIDQDSRTPYVSWWPEEEITAADMMRVLDGGPADVLLTHDMPDHMEALTAIRLNMHPGGRSCRQAVSAAINELRPKLHVHGHMHRRYQVRLDNGTWTEGLDCDGTGPSSWYVIDTETFGK